MSELKRELPAKQEMKPVERVLSVLRLEEPDRVPHFEWEFSAEVVEALGGTRDYFNFIELMDIDAVMVAPRYRTTKIAADLLIDEWGATRRLGAENTALPVDDLAPIKTLAGMDTWQPPDPDDPYRYEGIQAAIERFGSKRAIFLQIRDVWSGPRDYIGYVQLFISLLENPEMVVGVAKKCVDHYVRIVGRAAEMGIHVVMSGDDVADNRGPMFAPSLWETLFVPQYRRLIEAIHDTGLCHWKHSDGNMYPLLDSIVAAGSDGIDPIDPLGGMELSVVKAKYGRSVAIKGNVDQIKLLQYGPPAQVVEAVKRCIREAGIGGGYVCSSSNSIHSGVDPKLYKEMVEAIHHYGRYPLDMDLLSPTISG